MVASDGCMRLLGFPVVGPAAEFENLSVRRLLVFAPLLARFGLIDLIAKGYGTLTWFFLLIFVIPILTWGVWKLKANPQPA